MRNWTIGLIAAMALAPAGADAFSPNGDIGAVDTLGSGGCQVETRLSGENEVAQVIITFNGHENYAGGSYFNGVGAKTAGP
jgi:hypothetical protein